MIHEATISKYALGREGWLIQAAFISAGLGYAGVARLMHGRITLVLWCIVAAFVLMGAFKIDSVGPNNVVSVHGALHTIAFFVVVRRDRSVRPRRRGRRWMPDRSVHAASRVVY